jgi:hypothetical protein
MIDYGDDLTPFKASFFIFVVFSKYWKIKQIFWLEK